MRTTSKVALPRGVSLRHCVLRVSQAALVLAVPLLGILPLLSTGCSKTSTSGTKTSGPVAARDTGGGRETPSPAPSPGPAASGEKIKVGILHSLTGFMAISEVSLKDVELMAIQEINDAGGVDVGGKKMLIEPIVEDPASDFAKGFPEKAKKLLLDDQVAVVFGCWTSASRKSVLPVFESNNGLLVYPVQYEGNECSKNVLYTGAAPNQQILPAVDYLWKDMGKKKFYLLGSDYIFPRTANQIVKAQLSNVYNAKAVAEKYADLGEKDFKPIVDDIKKVRPDVIFSTINGDSNIPFYNELAQNGITADVCPVCAMSVAEDELRGLIGQTKIEGHLAAWNYFETVKTPQNEKFVADFKKFVKDPKRVTDDPIEASYFQVYLWKLAVERAKSTKVNKVLAAIHNAANPIEFDAPEGKIRLDPKNNHTWKYFHMGRVKADGQFDIIYTYKENGQPALIRPEPYPRVAYKKDCDWITHPTTGTFDLK